MKTSIVIGLGYGDEGKGLTTDFLCSQSNHPLVIRFSGGHQAGHTVVNESGQRHVFSHFGAGTFRQAPTYWSRFCTFNPFAYFNEKKALKALAYPPTLYVDALCPVTTPYDINFNQNSEKKLRHGSCGVGFGATVSRDLTPYKLYAQDLKYPIVVRQRLKAIKAYYLKKTGDQEWIDSLAEEIELFTHLTDELGPNLHIVQEQRFLSNLSRYDHLVFEGSQGILLDMDHGFFPNVTFANTTSKNAWALLSKAKLPKHVKPELYYITRAYQTRHGNGFLSNEEMKLAYTPNPEETNVYNEWQGHQRVSPLDLDLINYALESDKNYSGDCRRHLVLTCMDQLEGDLEATIGGKSFFYSSSLMLLSELHTRFSSLFESYSDRASGIITRKRVLAA